LKNRQIFWKNWAVVILVLITLNFSQIISEKQTDYANLKAFIASISDDDSENKKEILLNLSKDIDCHFQANLHIISSMGDKKDCSFYVASLIGSEKFEKDFDRIKDPALVHGIFLTFVFSLLGYGMMVHNFRKEKELSKKYFLGLTVLYSGLSFLVMLPVISSALRYFVHVIFIPYIFLGLNVKWLQTKYSGKHFSVAVIGIFFAIIAWLNFSSIQPVVKKLSDKTRNEPQDKIVLGESESIADFIIAESFPKKEAYLLAGAKYTNFLKPLNYIASDQDFSLLIRKKEEKISTEQVVFFVTSKDDTVSSAKYKKIINYRNFGQVNVYKVEE
jgi:hypothetical protein